MIFKVVLLSVLLAVSMAGQCWWCKDTLIPGICNQRRAFDGDCIYRNNRCLPKAIQKSPSGLSIYTALTRQKMRCKNRKYNQCTGLDSLNPRLKCVLNPYTVACEAVDFSYSCSDYAL